jgi:DNA-binding NarL/FixJ family response regulator
MSPVASVWRVLVVERQPILTPEIRNRLARDPELALVGRCDSAAEATRIVRDTPVDLVLVESTLAEPGALELARFFKVRHARVAIAFVTRAASQTELFEAARVGVAAYVRASAEPEEFLEALRRAASGEFPIDDEVVRYPAVATRILAQFRQASAPAAEDGSPLGPLLMPLSAREIEILDLVARGNSNKLIARELRISDQTVKNHISAILRKLEVNDRTEAVVYALRNGWISLSSAALR